MMDFTPRIISALKKDTRDRSLEDFNALFEYFVQIPQFAAWSNAGLRNTCQLARYIECAENTVLFKRYTPAKCWYLLMSGSVYCGNQMYYGGSVFGQSTPPFPCVRQDDCVALEYCQIVVVEYTPQEMVGTQHGSFRGSLRGYPGRFKDNASVESMSNHSGEMVLCERDSVDGKSASSIDSYPDLLGLTEGVVDSDEESDEISQFSWHVADPLRECLGKKPTERTDAEVETIFGEVSHLPSLIKLPPAVRKELCRCMLYKVYHNSGLRVSSHGQELHAWHVLLNGVLEVREEGLPPELLHVGDSFGMPAATQVLKQQGDVFTRSEDCHVLFIPRSDFLRIINQGELNTKRVRDEEDMVVLITELRASVSGQPPGDVVTAATPMRLISHLRDNLNSIDPDYTQDFLLTYRTFLPDTALLTNALLTWFKDSSYRYKILSIVMSWVSSHFTDFDYNNQLWQFLEQFESELRVWNLKAELNQFRQLCASRTLLRNLVIIRDKGDPIPLLVGGAQIGCPIFVTKTAEGSSFEKAGLRTFDELLQFNDTRLDQFTEDRVAKMLSQSTHFTMVVRSNKLDCKEAILRAESDNTKNRSLDTVKSLPGTDNNSMGKNKSFSGLIDTFRPRKNNKKSRMDETVPTRYEIGFNNSHSYDEYKTISRQREAVKLYRDDQSFKYISIGPDTNALDLVYIAMEQFDISEDVSHFKLCEVIAVHAGAVRQKQLAPTTVNLANRLSLSSRYYLKDSRKAESLVSEDSAQEMLRDTVTNLLMLDAEEIARQLTINSFEIFREICSVEYVTDLFSVKSGYGTHKLEEFAETVNTEMYWVATEIVSEKNVLKRARLIKQFIKIAVYCQSCNNFNSMFCILSGLAHASVKRLDDTWCKLPGKWVRAFEDLHDLLDPSRNMYKYRTLVNSAPVKAPMIPFFPVLKKDLTFIHLGIESKTKTKTGNKLINFEKLRLVSREVQNIAQYSSVGYNPRTMFQLGGDTGSSARLRRKETNLASAASSSKKLYEQGLMQRKVALYLSKITNLDEATLRQHSHQCEPPSPDFQPIRRSSMPDLRDERSRAVSENDGPTQEPLPELKKSTSVESVSSKRYLSALDSDHRPRPEGAETLPPTVPPRLDLPSALQSSFRKKLEQSKNSTNEGGTQPLKAFKSPSPDSSTSPTPTSLTPKSLSPASSNQSCNSTASPDIPPVPPRSRSDTTV